MNENLEKKRALCEQAEALKDSTDWKATSEILSKLQKDWKKIGPVSKKYSEPIWKRFVSACDYFFDQKAKATSSQKSVEHANLEKKKTIITQLEEINKDEVPASETSIRNLMKEWNSIGHVPFKDKDKIYKQYRSVVDELFDKLNLSASEKKLSNFKTSISNKENNLYREREKLMRAFENMKAEIKTYENNLGFLTTSSKKGNSLVNEMNRKVEKLKADLALIQKKIEVIDESIKEE
jgi:chromosome segregation ATPase